MIWKRHANYITAICNFDFSISKGVSHIFPSYFREKKVHLIQIKILRNPALLPSKLSFTHYKFLLVGKLAGYDGL